MGTPEFAVPSLTALLDAGYHVVAAVTQPDRPSGRSGHTLIPCPVKALAAARRVPVLQFERIRRQEGIDALRALSPDLFVTAAFGQILSEKVLAIPRLGTVNVHASLLPRHRGAAPIHWAILSGDRQTGITTMLTDKGIDTGDMLLSRAVDILPEETAGQLTERLAKLGAEVLLDTLPPFLAGTLTPTPQDPDVATYDPMLAKELGVIDWTRDAEALSNLVRGVNPWPGAQGEVHGLGLLKIWRARAVPGEGTPGTPLVLDAKRGLTVACGAGALELTEVQAPGGRRMTASEFVRGRAGR